MEFVLPCLEGRAKRRNSLILPVPPWRYCTSFRDDVSTCTNPPAWIEVIAERQNYLLFDGMGGGLERRAAGQRN